MGDVDRELRVQKIIQKAQAVKEFMASAAFTESVKPYLDSRKRDLLDKAYFHVENHAVMAAAIGALHEIELLEDGLKATVAQEGMTVDDLPEDDSPEISQ